MAQPVIDLKGLTKFYGKYRGVEDVTFSVEPGEIFGFIGPNGAGKSTTIRTLMALIRPTGGSASILGMDCIRDAERIAKDVGYLPAESNYYAGMRVRELLEYTAALFGQKDSARGLELAQRLHLDVTRKIADLSFGNKKKVGIVCALMHEPKLLILDEPTSGLDPLVQQTFFDILREENAKGVTILFSSHVLSEVQRLCERVAILKEGKLIGLQKVSELREQGYKRIELTCEQPVDAKTFNGTHIADFQQRGDRTSFIFQGNVAELLARLHTLGVTDIFIQEPTLEEIFLHYYQ